MIDSRNDTERSPKSRANQRDESGNSTLFTMNPNFGLTLCSHMNEDHKRQESPSTRATTTNVQTSSQTCSRSCIDGSASATNDSMIPNTNVVAEENWTDSGRSKNYFTFLNAMNTNDGRGPSSNYKRSDNDGRLVEGSFPSIEDSLPPISPWNPPIQVNSEHRHSDILNNQASIYQLFYLLLI